MRVQVVDPSAYTPPYDHALCAALARAGADVELVTSAFPYGAAPPPDGYAVRNLFYGHARGAPGSRMRRAAKLIEHVPGMLALRRLALESDVVHFQWLPVQPIDRHLLPRRPVALTAHDLLPREPRPLQVGAQRRLYAAVDAVVVHSQFGRRTLIEQAGVDPGKVRVIHHGAFDYLAHVSPGPLPRELGGDAAADGAGGAGAEGVAGRGADGAEDRGAPVVMFFGLLRPYKGIGVLLEAWREVAAQHEQAELWIVGRPRMSLDGFKAAAPPRVRWVTRFVPDTELAACFHRADIVVLPYLSTDRLDFSGVLATALAFARPAVVSDVGGLGEVAEAGGALRVPPGDPEALASALGSLIADPARRDRLAEGARSAATGTYSWALAAEQTIELYRELVT